MGKFWIYEGMNILWAMSYISWAFCHVHSFRLSYLLTICVWGHFNRKVRESELSKTKPATTMVFIVFFLPEIHLFWKIHVSLKPVYIPPCLCLCIHHHHMIEEIVLKLLFPWKAFLVNAKSSNCSFENGFPENLHWEQFGFVSPQKCNDAYFKSNHISIPKISSFIFGHFQSCPRRDRLFQFARCMRALYFPSFAYITLSGVKRSSGPHIFAPSMHYGQKM